MNKIKLMAGILMTLAAFQGARADDPFQLATVQVKVVGYAKETLTIQPAESGARPGALLVTGTNRVSVASPQTRDGRTFMVQRDVEVKTLAE